MEVQIQVVQEEAVEAVELRQVVGAVVEAARPYCWAKEEEEVALRILVVEGVVVEVEGLQRVLVEAEVEVVEVEVVLRVQVAEVEPLVALELLD